MECITCVSSYCLRCSSSECLQCQSGYSIDPTDNQGCIANCQDGQYLLNGECVYECSLQSYNNSYDTTSNTCIQQQKCPLFSYIPISQALSLIQYFSTFTKEDLYFIIFGQPPQFIKSITPKTYVVQIICSDQIMILIGGQNQTAIQVLKINLNEELTEITSSVPQAFLNSDCIWNSGHVFFTQKQNYLYIFNLTDNNIIPSYTLKLDQPLVCLISALDYYQTDDTFYLLTLIKQDMQIQELSKNQEETSDSNQIYYSSEQHDSFTSTYIFAIPPINLLQSSLYNQILELKGNGITLQYDLISRKITKQFYFWDNFYYPDQFNSQSFVFYNCLIVEEEEKIILTGIRNGILTIREINLYTFEVFPIGAYIPNFIRYGNKVIICTNTYMLTYYDGDSNLMVTYQNQYYGQNIDAIIHNQAQLIFVNTQVYLTISLDDQNIQLQQTSSKAYRHSYQFQDILIPLTSSNNQQQQLIDLKQLLCYQYKNNDYLNATLNMFVINLYELDIQLNLLINYIQVIKYQQKIATIQIDLSQNLNLVNQNYKYYYMYDNKGFYNHYHNYMVIISGYNLIFIDSSTFNILLHYVSQAIFQNVAYDIQLGYLVFQDSFKDCFVSLDKISLNCIQNNNQFSEDLLHGTIIQREGQLIIFYSQYSLRVYSLKEQIYKMNVYSNYFIPYSVYYDDFSKNIIFGEYITQQFMIVNLQKFTIAPIPFFPSFKTQTLQNLYKLYFFSDLKKVILFSSYTSYIIIYDLSTLAYLSTIQLQYQFNQQSQVAVDENLNLVMFIDNQNQIEIVSYKTNQIVKTFQMEQIKNDANSYQKILIWDSFKRKILVGLDNIFYIFDYDNNIFICRYQFNLVIFDIYISNNKNQIFVTDYLNLRVFDYSIIEYNYNLLPQYLVPNLLKINQNQYILFDNSQSTIKNIVQGEVKDYKYFNSIHYSHFYFNFYNESSSQIYVITFNQLSIYQVTATTLTQIFSQLLDSQILTFISESNEQLLFLTQKQSLYFLSKNQSQPNLNILTYIPTGVGEYIMVNNTYLIYSSTKNSSQWNKLTLLNVVSESPQFKLEQFIFSLEKNDTVKQLISIDNTLNVIMLTNKYIQIVDIQTGNLQQKAPLDFQSQWSKIYFDALFQRILYSDRIIGVKVYDINLQTIISSLPSSGIRLKIKDSFIFMLSFNSVSIYLRQDFKLFQVVRNFNSTQQLIDIEYTGYSYIFILHFDTSISFIHASPYQQPQFIDTVFVSNYVILQNEIQQNNAQYLIVNMIIVTIQYTIQYISELNISSIQNNFCSAELQIITSQSDQITMQQQSDYQNLLQLKQLQIQKIIYSLYINNDEQTDLKYPFINPSSVTNDYSLSIQAVNSNNIYLKTQNNVDSNIVELQLNGLNLSFKNINNTQYIFSNQTFSKLVRLILNDIQLSDIGSNQLLFKGIDHIFIKDLIINGESIELSNDSIFIFEEANFVIFQNITLINCEFSNILNIFQFQNINQLTIVNFNIKFNKFSSNTNLNSIINVSNAKSFTLNNTNILQNNLENIEIFKTTNIIEISINNMTLSQNKITINKGLDLQGIILYLESTSSISINLIEFDKLSISSIQSLSLLKLSNVNQTLELNDLEFTSSIINSNQTSYVINQDYYILECEGIFFSTFSNIQISNSDNLGFIYMHDLSNNNGIIIQNQKSICNNYQHNNSETNILMQLNAQQLFISNSNFFNITNQYSDSCLILIQTSQNLILDQIYIQNISIKQNSFFSIFEVPQVLIQNIESKYIETKSIASVFYLEKISNLTIKNNQFISNLSYLDGGAIYLNQINEITFVNNTYQENQSLTGNGGAIYCFSSIFSQFKGNYFYMNSSPQGSGGAIQLNSCDIQDMVENTFKQNYAQIGGAFRYQGIQPQVLQKNNFSQRMLTSNLNYFTKNSAKLYGKNIGSYPILLDVKNQLSDDDRVSKAKLENLQSGSTSTPIIMRLIDEEMREVSFFKNTSDINQDILIEFGNYFLEVQSQQIGLDGNLRQNYNFDNYGFIFNVSYSFQPNSDSTILIKTVNTIPVLNTTTFIFDEQELSLSIDVNFRQCQQGEILQNLQKYKICYTCQQGNYCLEDPNQYENQQCLKCPIGSKNCYSNVIQLLNGYWSQSENSDQIYQCINPQNCIPEDPSNKFGCSIGHIGAICESCDSQGTVWGGKYGRSNGGVQCQECIKQNSIYSILALCLLLIIFCCYLIFQVQRQVAFLQRKMSWFYLRKLKIMLLQNQNISSSSSYLKILINYLQFLALINNLGIQTYQYFNIIEIGGGDPAQQTVYNLDCIFNNFDIGLPLYAIRVLFINCQIIIIYLLIQLVKQLTNMFKMDDNQFLISSFILVYLFFSSSVIKVLIQSLSCREISNRLYIIQEMQYECYTNQHQNIIFYLIGPLLSIWFILIPLTFYLHLYRKRQKLQSLLCLKTFGLLYQEYKEESYYWDLARNQTRSSLVIFLNLIRTSPMLKSQFLQLLMFIYLRFLKKVSPYQRQQLNNIDQLSCKFVILSIFILQMMIATENQIFSNLLQVILIVINISFIAILLLLILQKPIPQNYQKRNIFQRFQVMLSKLIPSSIYQINYQKQIDILRINSLWKKVKSSLRQIIEFEVDIKNQKWASSKIIQTQRIIQSQRLRKSYHRRAYLQKQAQESILIENNIK
ncbi:hypothetical protein ABPG73_007105 [Tetrahymena malaccensis]